MQRLKDLLKKLPKNISYNMNKNKKYTYLLLSIKKGKETYWVLFIIPNELLNKRIFYIKKDGRSVLYFDKSFNRIIKKKIIK